VLETEYLYAQECSWTPASHHNKTNLKLIEDFNTGPETETTERKHRESHVAWG
jgi:hypothetical protein